MPELPDVTAYVEGLSRRVSGEPLLALRLASPFVLRSVAPPPRELEGRRVEGVRRLGKQVVMAFEAELFLVVHLMIAGRLRWRSPAPAPLPRRRALAALDFDAGSVVLTEASSKKRASLHVVRGASALERFDRGGLEVLEADSEAFSRRLRVENRTLKRALTDPRLFSGIGNAYSDEILHRARLSPVTWTSRLDEAECLRLHAAARDVLTEWTERIRTEVGDGFPERVTAFREGMAVHGRHGRPCTDCGTSVQRVVFAENEMNYCPRCQTGGKLLADRALSRLLRGDWPKTLEELEARKER